MTETNNNNFFFLNRDGKWPGFHLRAGSNCTRTDRSSFLRCRCWPVPSPMRLRLRQFPKLQRGSQSIAAGLCISATRTKTAYDGCSDAMARSMGFRAWARDEASLGSDTPRGLLIAAQARQALFVVDTANHRILIFDLQSFELLEVWGQPTPYATRPGSEPGQFNTLQDTRRRLRWQCLRRRLWQPARTKVQCNRRSSSNSSPRQHKSFGPAFV